MSVNSGDTISWTILVIYTQTILGIFVKKCGNTIQLKYLLANIRTTQTLGNHFRHILVHEAAKDGQPFCIATTSKEVYHIMQEKNTEQI